MKEDEQRDRDTLAQLRKEYQLYKDLWGLNLKYSHGAGESKNYSKILIFRIIFLRLSLSCQDSPWAPDGSHLLWQLNIWRSWKGRKGENISLVNCNAFWLVGRGKKRKRDENFFYGNPMSLNQRWPWLALWAWSAVRWVFSLASRSSVASRFSTLLPNSFYQWQSFKRGEALTFKLSLCFMYQVISKAYLDVKKWSGISDSLPLKWGQNDSLRGKDVSNIVGDWRACIY